MKKKLLALILVVFIISMNISMAVLANVGGALQGTALSGNLGSYTIDADGSYYLSGDTTANITIADGKEVVLDLNGHILKSAADGSPVIKVGEADDSSAKLTINDSNPSAVHSGDYESLTGGIITGGYNNTNGSNGGGIANYGTLIMNGGTVTKNKTSGTDGTGGGVYNQGTFTMNTGVAITGNESVGNGGGVSNKGSFIMNGGEITNNKSSNGTNGGAGGGVYNEENFEMYGGEISGNTSGACGGGVDNSYGANCHMVLGGTAVIKNNTSGKGTDNLYNEAGKYVTVATGEKAPVAGKMDIGVRLASGTGAVTIACDTDYTSFFTSDNTSYAVYNNGKDSSQQVCIGNIEALNVETGYYYDTLSEAFADVQDGQTIMILKDICRNIDGWDYYKKSVTLDLNGYVLSPNSSAKEETIISVIKTSSLTITDSRPTAKHTGSYAALPDGGVITGCESGSGAVSNGGTLTIVGGTITGNSLGVYNVCDYWCDNWDEVPLKFYLIGGFLHLGGNAKITGNTNDDGNASNVYLGEETYDVDGTDTSYVIKTTVSIGTKTAISEGNGVAEPVEGMSVGITLAGNTGAFTSNGKKTDEAYFFSDNTAYAVKYNNANTTDETSDDYLELVTGYTVTCSECTNGSVSAGNHASAYDGEEVTVTVTPDEGYELDTLTVKDAESGNVTINGYTFTMPAKNVTVSATFKKTPEPVCYIDLNNNGSFDGNDVKYKTIAGAIAVAKPSDESKANPTVIRMIADSNENITVSSERFITLDLNGNVLKGTGSGSVIGDYGSLVITDSAVTTEHYFTYSTTSAWTLNTSATDEQKKAAITLGDINNETANGTLIKIGGGIITGGNSSSNSGGILVASGCNFEMTGGTICGNNANEGGGIYTGTQVTMVLENVSVVGNHAVKQFGGVLFNANTNGGACSLTLGGTVNIFGNTAGEANNLILWDSSLAPVIIDNDKPLTSDSKISVALKSGRTTGAFTKNGTEGDVSKFISDDTGYVIKFVTDHLEIAHVHDWTYELSEDKKTVTASCSGKAPCDYTCSKTLTIQAPASLEYDGASHDATFGETTVFTDGSLPTISYQYKADKNGEYTTAADTMKPGYYKASFTVGQGTGAKTAYIEYEVTKKLLTIGGNPTTADGKIYDGTTVANAHLGEVAGIVSGEEVVVEIDTANFEDENAGNGKKVTVTYKVTGDDAGNYIAPVNDVTYADIDSKQLTISTEIGKETTVYGKVYDGNTTASAQIGTVEGIVEGDQVTVEVYSAVFSDKNAGANKTVTVTYKLSGTSAANYIVPVADSTFKANISPKQLIISTETGKRTTVSDKVYDGNVTASAKIGTVEGLAEGDKVTVEITSANFTDKNAGDSKEVTIIYGLSGDDASNYSKPENETILATIAAKVINVIGDSKASYIGSELEKLTYTADELISGDSFTGELSTDADKNKVKAYEILQGSLAVSDGNSGKNYAINYIKGTYTVTAKEIQIITFTGVTNGNVKKTYGDQPFTEAVSGAETNIIYSSSDTSVATVDGNGKVTILKSGTAIITASAAEDYKYAPASAQYILTVSKIMVDIPEVVTGIVYNGKEQTGVELPKNAVYTLTDNVKTDAGNYTAVASLKDKANYAWSVTESTSEDRNLEWSIERATVTVAAEDKSMYLGDDVPEFESRVTGLIGNDEVRYSFNTLNPEAQGIYSIVPSGEPVQGNYDITYVNGVLSVTKKESDAKAEPKDIAEVFKKYKTMEEYKGKSLDVEVRTDQNVPEVYKTLVSQKIGSGKKVQFMETSLFLIIKSADGTTEKNIGDENDTLISVSYTFDFSDKENVQVLRVHENNDGAAVDELTEKPNADGECITANEKDGTITVTSKKYSTFAIAYDEVEIPYTNDANNLWSYIILEAFALCAVVVTVIERKRRMLSETEKRQ